MSDKVCVTGISLPADLYTVLEQKRGSISRSRYYVDLIRLGLKQGEDFLD
jgi:hypothetical protein